MIRKRWETPAAIFIQKFARRYVVQRVFKKQIIQIKQAGFVLFFGIIFFMFLFLKSKCEGEKSYDNYSKKCEMLFSEIGCEKYASSSK